MLIWQQPLMLATSGGSIPIQANAKYINTGAVGTTGSGSVSRDSSGMITTWVTNGTAGGTITALYSFNKGPVIALSGTWRWSGSAETITINVGGKSTSLSRSGGSSITLDGAATNMTANNSSDVTLKFVVDLNANTSTVYQSVNSAWVLKKTVPFIPDLTKLNGYVYVAGRDDPANSYSSFFYGAGIYNNADLAAA